MGLILISPPATDPITLSEAKDHLRVTSSDNDALITQLIKAATRYAEKFLGRALIDQTWDLYLDSFPTSGQKEIKIPLPPLIEVIQVAYDDGAGIEQTVGVDDYYVDSVSQPGWIVPQGGTSWPATLDAINAVRIRFRAGYLDNGSPQQQNVPDDIRAAIKLTLGALYENREQVIAEAGRTTAIALPWGAEQLLRMRRVELSMA
jgi:uncharacterized phiE125 gp8 family phage protein